MADTLWDIMNQMAEKDGKTVNQCTEVLTHEEVSERLWGETNGWYHNPQDEIIWHVMAEQGAGSLLVYGLSDGLYALCPMDWA